MSEGDATKVWYRGRFASLGEVKREKRIGDLNDTDLKILKSLLEKGEPVRVDELAGELDLGKGYLNTIISKRLTPKYTLKIGKRGFLVGLTEEGVKAANAA